MEPIAGKKAEIILDHNFNFVHQDCMLCKSKQPIPLDEITWKQLVFKYVVCENCGLVYMNPVPNKESYIEFYKNDFWDVKTGKIEDHKGRKRDDDKGEELSISYQQNKRIPRISKALSYLGPNPKVLEIGCAYGANLAGLYEKFKIQPYAVEPSEDAVNSLNNNFPYIKVIGRTAEDMIDNREFDGFFDLVIFSHCLENVTEPNSVLKAVHRLLGEGKYLYVDTPNLFWSRAMNPYHPFIYTPDTLGKLVGKAGFKIVHVDASPDPKGFISDVFSSHKPHFFIVSQKSGPQDIQMKNPKAKGIKGLFETSRKILDTQIKIKRFKRKIGIK